MDAARTLLDRELLLAAIVHELRGPITAVCGFIELEEDHPRPSLAAAADRLTSLANALSDSSVSTPERDVLRGVPVTVKGPLEVLEVAIAGLTHRAVEVADAADHVAVTITGVPVEELAAGWSIAQVRRWLAEDGPGLAGARLRIAARIVGALRYTFPIVSGESESTVHIRLARG
jgi:signal transduction histidine kinase